MDQKQSCDYSITENNFLEFLILYYILSMNSFGFIKQTEKASPLVNTYLLCPSFKFTMTELEWTELWTYETHYKSFKWKCDLMF